ncbi:MAG: ComEA family DNA-binding protein [Bacteroidota bacterium]
MRTFWVYSIARIGKQEALVLGFLSLMTWAVPTFREWSMPNEGSVEVKDPYLLGLIQEVQDEERLNRKNAQEGKAFLAKLRPGEHIDLNKADTSELMRLRGVGPSLARRIWTYRKRLGGFGQERQLLEVYGMDSITFEVVQRYVTLESSSIQQISINKADVEVLSDHPYVGWSLAKRMVAYRRQHGPYPSTNALFQILGTDSSQWLRALPYLKQ